MIKDQQLSTLPMLLNILKNKIMEGQLKYFEEQGLSKQHIPYIIMLFNHQEGLTQKEMVDKIKLDKAHASRALQELEEKKFVVKDMHKGYKKKHYLTDKGIKLAEKMKQKRDENLDNVFSKISDEEKVTLEKILKKIIDHI